MSRFFILGIPHTATNRDYVACAFTQKVLKLCQMLKMRGHTVIHLGNELSEVECDEHVTVTAAGDINPPAEFLNYDLRSPVYAKFLDNAIREIALRKEPNDFLLCPWGAGHKAVADLHSDLIAVESGIGYSGGYFAPFRVFESYAILHAQYGTEACRLADHYRWYDVVIPNSFDPADFLFNPGPRDDYVLFLGFRHNGTGKGYQVAVDATREAGYRLIVAGPSPLPENSPEHVEYAGLVGVDQRAELLAHARALIAPSLFLEPFCGVQVEAMLSGTPVIGSSWGALTEYNLHGLTGYHCRTHSEFVWALRNADRIDPYVCQRWAQNFTLEKVSRQYDEYFRSVLDVRTGLGWYQPHPERTQLDSRTLFDALAKPVVKPRRARAQKKAAA